MYNKCPEVCVNSRRSEALQLMRKGDVWEIVLPSSIAYGDEGAGRVLSYRNRY